VTGGLRIAAVGDIHAGVEPASAHRLRQGFAHVGDAVDALLLAGDLTRCGDPVEAAVVADAAARAGVPTVAVLGNHDLHSGRVAEVVDVLASAGVTVLEGAGTVVDLPTGRLGVTGGKGFGGGFAGACVSEFGEPEVKEFARHAAAVADRLAAAMARTTAVGGIDAHVVLLHYSPVRDTLQGEPPEIYPFLGSYLLAEAVDRVGADLVVHGHAHRGTEKGVTPGGIRVRNVAQPVLRSAYRVFELPRRAVPERLASPPGGSTPAARRL
jgi:Icc-related predicted phosphoesterase